jgi:hypothetical protein
LTTFLYLRYNAAPTGFPILQSALFDAKTPKTTKETLMTSERDREIKRRRQRRDKVRKLRARLERTTDVRQRAVVIRKIQRVSPTAPVPES